MATVTIDFDWSNGDSEFQDFDATGGLIADIETYRDDRLEELNDEQDECTDGDDCIDEIECTAWNVHDYDTDHSDQKGPEDFSDLDDWADYCDLVDQHGEAYVLRHNDVGDFDFDDEYNGCWADTEEFVRNLIEDCYDLNIPSFVYVDWERTARDVMMDYSEYDGCDGVHIFRC